MPVRYLESLIVSILFVTLFQDVSSQTVKKELEAERTSATIKIDGLLEESAWQSAEVATDFVQHEPQPSGQPSQRTEVRILYNNKAIYVGAMLHDVDPDSILRELSERDRLGNTDWFGVFFDPYRNGSSGNSFLVSAAGVQFDAQYGLWGEDSNWDGVWDSKVQILDNGWSVEMRIPYSAIRFTAADEQQWGINFGRLIRRIREKSFWNEVDPAVNGFLTQFGILNGLKDVDSPVRLSFTPYVSGNITHFSGETGSAAWSRGGNAGMDLKYGLSDAFTLDMTLIPDFGQVASDNQVLNLSPFEVRFDENRPFFTEGTELFNKGGLFYSRRIGGRPIAFSDVSDELEKEEEIIDNPSEVGLLNATKISGRTSGGLGIGVFNAISGNTYATVRDSLGAERQVKTDPITNYNVFVLDQNLKNNSSVAFISASTLRFGDFYDANVSAATVNLKNKNLTYSIEGKVAMSHIFNRSDKTERGYNTFVALRKIGGNWRYGLEQGIESDRYDPNDLGFLFANNEVFYSAYARYHWFTPNKIFNQARLGGNIWTSYLYKPYAFSSAFINLNGWAQLKNFTSVGFFTSLAPVENKDYFEAREEGMFFREDDRLHLSGWVSTDYRKRFALDVDAGHTVFFNSQRSFFGIGVSPRVRVNNHLSLILELRREESKHDLGYVTHLEEDETEVLFGERNDVTFINSLTAKYIFNNKMSLNFRARHYHRVVEYLDYLRLRQDGYLEDSDYNGLYNAEDESVIDGSNNAGDSKHNISFNSFNIDLVYRWRFAPGSDLYLVWKNAIFQNDDDVAAGYFDNLSKTFNADQTNSLSLKLIYYLDYLQLKKRQS